MQKKPIAIWILTTLTFISVAHFVEAILVIVGNNPIRLPQVYPLIGEALGAMAPVTYFYTSAAITALLWGITCLVAFNSPVEGYLNQHKQDEAEFLQKSALIDRVCDTVESDHHTLSQLKDLMRTIQAEVKDVQNGKPKKSGLSTQSDIRRDTPPPLKTPFPHRNSIQSLKAAPTSQRAMSESRQKPVKDASSSQKMNVKKPSVKIGFGLGKKK